MAKPNTLTFGKFKIYVEDPANPGSFIAPCGFTDKSLTLTAATAEEEIPDCDNPDAPAWVGRNIKSLSATVAGQGVFAGEAHATWRNYWLGGASFNVRVVFDATGVNGGGYWQGAACLTSLANAVQLGQKVSANVSLDSDGEWKWTDAA